MKKILVVEDDQMLNRNIAFALSSEGFDVDSAFTIEETEERCGDAQLIIMDVMLPDGNGLEFCKRFRSNARQPIIFLTSCDDENDVINGFESGGDDYITKPFRLKELISRINAVFRRCYSQTENAEFTAIEKKLLDYLIVNKEHFVTREQIFEYLWDSKGNYVNDNTLSVTISRLREKLTDGKIVTKRGMGYKWTQQTNL